MRPCVLYVGYFISDGKIRDIAPPNRCWYQKTRVFMLPHIVRFHFNITQWLKLWTSNLVHSLGLPRPTTKLYSGEKWAWPWELPYIWGSSLIFLQRPRCPLSVSGASCICLYFTVHSVANRKIVFSLWSIFAFIQGAENKVAP